MIECYDGNLLDVFIQNENVAICHQVNCYGKFGAGIAKQIAQRWPAVLVDYQNYVNNRMGIFGDDGGDLLGSICKTLLNSNRNQWVVHLFGQIGYGRAMRYTNYEGLYEALEKTKLFCADLKLTTVAFPQGMSCGLAGGNWEIVKTMISEVFKDDITVKIVRFVK